MSVNPNISGAVKIKTYKVALRGLRGVAVTLPTVWVKDLDIKPGDELGIFRDTEDRLIIVLESRGSMKAKRRAS
jgi:hypothetical protein